MLLKQILLSLALVIIFIGCAPSKLAIDEFEIIGQVLDDESEEPIENVVVYVKSIGWDCDPATDEDGVIGYQESMLTPPNRQPSAVASLPSMR